MNRRNRILLLVIVMVAGGILILVRPPAKYNSVMYLARRYGVGKSDVQDVANAYGVDPKDLATFGQQPFPINYIGHTLGLPGWEQSRPSIVRRSEVEAFVTGYVSRCDLDEMTTLYLFYSDWLRPKTPFHGEALPMEIAYESDPNRSGTWDDQVAKHIQFYDVSDSGGLLWANVALTCNPPAKY